MALDINGYNAVFKKFTDFAQAKVDAGQTKAIADAHLQQPLLGGRRVLAVSTARNDAVHKWTRTNDQYIVNDRTRDLFRKAVADMFGGESKIPASVKEAMLLSDYNAGKPLTARRIMAVKAAIDADGTAKARSEKFRLESFDVPANKAAMLAKGYSKAELPRLARAAHFYAEINHCSEAAALEALTTSGSKANRIMQYGGRFLESSANFSNGLRLLDSFATWFAETKAALGALGKGRNFPDGASKTLLNGDSSYFGDDVLRGMEKFVFEEFACNAAHNLAEQDPEKLFGMENNAAMRLFGRGLANSFTQTVANIPPAKRAAFYAAMDAAFPLVSDPAVAKLSPPQRKAQGFQTVPHIDRGNVIGRVMKNLDKLQALLDKGPLTLRAFVKTCFPEARSYSIAGVNALVEEYEMAMNGDIINDIDPKYPRNLSGPMQLLMEETGCTIEEAFTAANGGKRPPVPKYAASGTLPLSAFDGTVREARDQLEGDLIRPANYSIKDGQEDILSDDAGFRFTFPDGASFKTNGSAEGRARIPTVADKVEELCGAVHREQASSVMMMLSQSGLGALRGGLSGYGVISSEHSAVDFTLSKDAETGAVTITYSSPEELPFRFEWTATVDVFGNVTSTPPKFEKPVENLNAAEARKILGDTAKKLGVALDKRSLAAGAALLAQHGNGMYAKNLGYFAGFIARQPLAGNKAAASAARIAAFAQDVKKWRSFPMGEGRAKPLAAAVARRHNEYIAECFADETKFHGEHGRRTSIFETFYQDANRNTYVINGKKFATGGELGGEALRNAVIDALKEALPGEKAQKAVSVLMNQSGPADMLRFTNKIPVDGKDAPENLHELPGADRFAHRDMTTGLYPTMLLNPHMSFALETAPDGRSATVTIGLDCTLEGGDGGQGAGASFGNVRMQERISIDLAPETPVVTDVAFAQQLV